MISIADAGFTDDFINDKPNYQKRYDWFVSEFIAYSLEVPDELKTEYNFLFDMLGRAEQNESIESRLNAFKVTLSDEVPMPEIVLSFCDLNGQNKRMVMTRQNISCVTAQAKVGKTFLIKLIVSSILKGSLFQNRLLSELPAGRDKVLYIDTEQSKFHVKLGLAQIKEMLTPEFEKELNKMDVYQLDAVSTVDRLAFVKWLIYNKKPDFVVIDGISDLALDTNSLKEADELVTNLRIWASENNCHICNVIHQNPNDLQTKMKGHLGTKLQDKSEIVIGVSIDKENDNNRIVQSSASRNRKPEPFEFSISENGVPFITSYEVTNSQLQGKKSPKAEKLPFQLFEVLKIVFNKQQGEINWYILSELVIEFKVAYKQMFKESISDNSVKELLIGLQTDGLLYKDTDKKYYIGQEPTAIF